MTILPNNFTDNHNFNTFISSFFKNHDLLVSPSSLTNYTSLIKDIDSHLRDLALDMIQNALFSRLGRQATNLLNPPNKRAKVLRRQEKIW